MGICNVSLVETFLLKLGYINLYKAQTHIVDIARLIVQVNCLVTGKKIRNFPYLFPSLQGDIYPLISIAVACQPLHFLGVQNQSDAGFWVTQKPCRRTSGRRVKCL